MNETTEQLKSLFDMNDYEAKIYSTILESPEIIASEIARRTGIPQNKVYQVTKSLIEDGLIISSPTAPVKYRAIDPEIGFKDKIEDMEALIKNLKQKFLSPPKREIAEKTDVWVVSTKDYEKIARFVLELVFKTKKRVLVLTGKYRQPWGEEDMKRLVKYIKSKKVEARIIVTRRTKDVKKEIKNAKKFGLKIKVLNYPKFPLKFDVFDDEYVFLMTHPSKKGLKLITGVLIKSKALTKFFVDRFEELWKKAK